MNIDKILLNEDELKRIYGNEPNSTFLYEEVNKAQCLKLLEWLKKPCECGSGNCLRDCPEGMSELESKLKEGR